MELFKNSHLRHQALQLDGWPRRNDRGDGNMTRIPWDDDKVITAVYVYIYNFVYDYIYICICILYTILYIVIYTCILYVYIYIWRFHKFNKWGIPTTMGFNTKTI